jgi:thymidylate kinase
MITPDNSLNGSSRLFCSFINALEDAGIAYCLLAGYETYPEIIPSDVDFMVSPADLPHLPALLHKVAADTGSLLVQALEHESTACYYVLAKQTGNTPAFLCVDASSDYRRQGRLWLSASAVLSRRRRHARGFFVPAPEDEFLYYFVKRVDKGLIHCEQLTRLRQRWMEAPQECTAALESLWPRSSVRALQKAFAKSDQRTINSRLPQLRRQLHKSSAQENLVQRLCQAGREFRRRTRRFLSPTGLFAVVLGPDGSGKSSVIAEIVRRLGPAFRHSDVHHLRPMLGARSHRKSKATTRPHALRPRGFISSSVKLAYWTFDYLAGYFGKLRNRLVHSTFVLFDRYYADLLIDPRRYRYGGPRWLAHLLAKLVPQPDLWMVLDAPAEVLQARKQEVPFAETERQRKAYLALARKLNAAVLDAAQPLDGVVGQACRAVLEHMAERTRRRWKLTAPQASSPELAMSEGKSR